MPMGKMYLGDTLISDPSATGGGGTPTGEWTPQPDWIDISNPTLGTINLLVNDSGHATYVFRVSTSTMGQYRVDWGDGTINTYDSPTDATHTYAIGTGQPCSWGYTTFKIVISAVTGNIISFGVTPNPLAKKPTYYGILWAVFATPYITSLAYAFYNNATISTYCRLLECVEFTVATDSLNAIDYICNTCYGLRKFNFVSFSGVSTAQYAFYYCCSLYKIDLSTMTSLTNASNMFIYCYSLTKVNIGTALSNVANMDNMFNNCCNLNSIDISSMVNVTSMNGVCGSCFTIREINIGGMTKVTSANSAFGSCYSLRTINATNTGQSATSTSFNYAFDNCEFLKNINLPNVKLSKISAKGSSGNLNKLETLTFSGMSLFGGTSPQIDISYTNMDSTQIDAIFSSLPTLTGKTIKITGSSGTAACDTGIANAKGWTVTQ